MGSNKRILKVIIVLIFASVLIYLIKNLHIYNRSNLLNLFISEEENRNFNIYFTVLITFLLIFFVPITWCSALSAFFFGIKGFFYMMIGIIFSAILSFYLAKVFREDVLRLIHYIYNRKKRKISLEEISQGIEKYGLGYVFFLRNIPIIPFNIANYISGISSVSVKDYFFGTLLALIPNQLINIYFFVKAIGIRANPLKALLAAAIKGIYMYLIYIWQRKNKYWIKE